MDVDAQLYSGWVAGDRSAGARLIARHLQTVSRFFINKSTATAEHDDLVAMTFERCAKSLGGYRGTGSFRGYLLGIALNVLRDELRRRSPDVPLGSISVAAGGRSPSSVFAERAEQRLLLTALRSLPVEAQVVLELHLLEELTREEMAEVLDLPAGTVAGRLRRARALLTAAVAELAQSASLGESTVSGLDAWARGVRQQLA